jgi:3-phenylpropionate/trans-cinnamate dioxygenase ferredoxin component
MSFEKVAALDQVATGGTLRVEVGGEPVCLVRLDESTVKAVHDTCSHQQWSLAEGWVEDNTIECDLHGSAFDLDTGDPRSLPAAKPIPVYACEVRGSEIWVDPDKQLNDAPVPRHL